MLTPNNYLLIHIIFDTLLGKPASDYVLPILTIIVQLTYCSFIQLDLGQLQVTNEFSWHGCPEKDPSAVHVDFLHAEVDLFGPFLSNMQCSMS